jgi:hypothetical protein
LTTHLFCVATNTDCSTFQTHDSTEVENGFRASPTYVVSSSVTLIRQTIRPKVIPLTSFLPSLSDLLCILSWQHIQVRK